MGTEAFVMELKYGPSMDSNNNVFSSIWDQYERVIVESLIKSFGLDFLVKDQVGGDVDTIHNVRNNRNADGTPIYKNSQNCADYCNRGEYNSAKYHSDKRYIEINRKVSENKKAGKLKDAYTGKRVARNADIDLDHVVAAKEIHDDPGRILSGLSGTDLANCEENLRPTDRSINRSMQQKDMDDYLEQWEQNSVARKERIQLLKNKGNLTDQERKELNKLEKLDSIDADKMRTENETARKAYETKINFAYYTSKKFALDTAKAAGTKGAQMGARQALGFVFAEVWFSAKAEIQNMPAGCDLKEILSAIERGVKRGFENAKLKYKEIISNYLEGFGAGILSSLTTTICNIFFTTAKNLGKCIREIYASVVQAGKVLLFNPDNLLFGDRIKTAAIIMASGASILAGTAVGELVGATPIGKIPVIGDIVQVFCSSLVSGLLSCSLLIVLDRSKWMNRVIGALNNIASEANNYAEIANYMEIIAAKLGELDIDKFREETRKFGETANLIANAKTEIELNNALRTTYKKLGISLPWEGDFDDFMRNKNNRLVFK